MKVLITIASTRPSHGGTSRSGPYLANALARAGVEVHLVTANPSGTGRPVYLSEEVTFHNLVERGWFQRTFRSPLRFGHHMEEVLQKVEPDLVHDQGVWLPSNWWAARLSDRHGVPLIVTPRGHLTEWSFDHKSIRKKVAWHLYQKRIMRRARCIHVTSLQEKGDLEKLGISGPFMEIPNGVQLPTESGLPPREGRQPRKALFLSRVDPKKGIPLLLKAWSLANTGNWELEIVGPGEERYVRYISFLMDKMEDRSVRLPGPVGEEDKWEVYRSADLFLLPSYSENFGIVVAEALAAGLPVITTTATPWRELEEHGCGWWIEPELDDLVNALEEALSADDERLREMGRRGQALVREKYDWNRIAERMITEYRQLVDA